MNTKLAQWFSFSSAVLLFVTASFILLSTFTRTVLLDVPDGLFAISSRKMFYTVAGIELALSAFLLVMRDPKTKLVLIAFVSCNLMIYHAGLAFANEANLFVCLGTLTQWVPVSPRILSGVMHGFHGSLFLGSCAFLVADWLALRKPAATPSQGRATPTVPAMQNC